MTRRYDTRRIKSKRSYTVKSIAQLLGVDVNTVRRWINKDGLPKLDDKRPVVISGAVLKRWLDERQAAQKQPCGPGEMYCPRCRAPKRLLPGCFYIEPSNTLKLIAKGRCADCNTKMTRIDSEKNRQAIIDAFQNKNS